PVFVACNATLCVNLVTAPRVRWHRVDIVYVNVSFGNVHVFLNLQRRKSILQLVGDPTGIQDASVAAALVSHASGLQALLAPPHAEEGDHITADHLRAIIGHLRARYDYVVVDTWPSYDDRVLALLEVADQILVPTGPELPAINNLVAFLRVVQLLGYPQEKLTPVLM